MRCISSQWSTPKEIAQLIAMLCFRGTVAVQKEQNPEELATQLSSQKLQVASHNSLMASPQVVVPECDNFSLLQLKKDPLNLDSKNIIDEAYDEDKEDQEEDDFLKDEDEVGNDNEQADMNEDNKLEEEVDAHDKEVEEVDDTEARDDDEHEDDEGNDVEGKDEEE